MCRRFKGKFMQTQLEQAPAGHADFSHPKNFGELVRERRATNHFTSEPVPDDVLNEILRLAAQAPSGFNLQPWRFIVVRDEESRRRLQKVAMNQEKVSEAPVVVIAIGMKEETKRMAEEILREGARRGNGKMETVPKVRDMALNFISTMPMEVWVNRHVMIAFTTMMLAAEAFGWDTAPMEGFDPAGVKREFGLPEEAEVIALLAIGRAKEPDKRYPGRLPLSRIVFSERYGERWTADHEENA
jgi:nitroreductase